MKLMTVVGARPQFVKAAPFSEVFRECNQEILVHTGQHYDANMSDIFFDELGIPRPDYNIGIGSGYHGAQTGRMLEKIEELLLIEKPDGLLVYGDTNSTLAGALAAGKLHIPVFHVEAGLRSYNRIMPEELNRLLTDHLSTLLLCPTETAVANLKMEGISDGVFNTGDIMYDAVLRNIQISKQKYSSGKWVEELGLSPDMSKLIREKSYALATIHRAENTDEPMKISEIFCALSALNVPVIMPLHPRTRKHIAGLGLPSGNIMLVEPVGYLLMLYLTANAQMVFTDSGGLQKEAYFLGTPCTTLRDQTEWVETLENGWNELTPIRSEEILQRAYRPLSRLKQSQLTAFGDGHAADRICVVIEKGGKNS